MLKAVSAGASAFNASLPRQEPLKNSIRKKLEGKITLEDQIQYSNGLMKIVNSDETGYTTFQMVYDDRVRLCKDKEHEIALDQIDLFYRHIFPIVVIGIICLFAFGLCMGKLIDAVCSIPQFDSKAEDALLKCVFPATVISVIALYFSERDERYKSYEKTLRERMILDRINNQRREALKVCYMKRDSK